MSRTIDRLECKGTEWKTPWEIVRDVRNLFDGSIELDPCTTRLNNVRAKRIYTVEEDGLKQPWCDRTYANPPFGETVKDWMQKTTQEAMLGYRIGFMLSVSRTETPYFQNTVLSSPELSCILFFKGKLKFNDGRDTGMLASWMFFFNIDPDRVRADMGHYGKVLVNG